MLLLTLAHILSAPGRAAVDVANAVTNSFSLFDDFMIQEGKQEESGATGWTRTNINPFRRRMPFLLDYGRKFIELYARKFIWCVIMESSHWSR